MTSSRLMAGTLGLLLCLSSLHGQTPVRTEQAAGRRQMAQSMQVRFQRSSPQVGDALPDIAGFRSDGTKVSLNSFRGKHTVLVFGCLT